MARRLTDVPGIGKKTERELRRSFSGDRPTGNIGKELNVSEVTSRSGSGLLDAKLAKDQKQALAQETGRAIGGEVAPRERSQSTQSTNTTNVGDFRVGKDERERAWNAHQERSALSQEQDEERRARITTDVDQWMSDKDSFDFPGIDTPSRKPRAQEKDEPFVDEDSLLRDLF